MKIIVPCTFFLGAKKRKNFLNLNTYRNAHFIALNNAKKQYKEVIQGELDKLSAFRMIKPQYRYYLPRKCDIGNVHAVLEKFFLDESLIILQPEPSFLITYPGKRSG